uniref:Uncharacterized protein n=1 Tax=Lepeophtheirus salmonis TaxID=72036 RepID=A0A0K2T299_LEPSM
MVSFFSTPVDIIFNISTIDIVEFMLYIISLQILSI